MRFVAKLQHTREVLAQQGRLSVRACVRALARDLAGDDEIVSELIDVQGVAPREGDVIVYAASSQPDTGTGIRHVEAERRAPAHLADKILRSKAALEGERKQVTVLFADVKGSM